LPSGQGTGWAGFILDDYMSADCNGARVATAFVSPQLTTTDAWQTLSGTTTQIPLGVASLAVRLVAVKASGEAALSALFDNVLVRVAP
jgi:hypothetical protein